MLANGSNSELYKMLKNNDLYSKLLKGIYNSTNEEIYS